MQPKLPSKFRPQARPIAELMWGRGGTHTYKTNRRGAYYFSCSGHGGYIVCANDLTDAEKVKLEKYVKPVSINIIIQTQKDGKEYVVGVDNTPLSRSGTAERTYRYNRLLGPARWGTFELYLFEEDCDWTILEKFTDIRLKPQDDNPTFYEAREAQIEATFSQYHGNNK